MPYSNDPRLVGDPVDTLTGAVVDRMLDFRLTGPIELRWTRHYDSSQSHRTFSVGNGCAHEYDRSLSIDAEGMLYEEPIGRIFRFPPLVSDGEECALHGFTISRVSSTCYHMRRHGQPAMEFVFQPNATRARITRLFKGSSEVKFTYDQAHRLVRIDDSAGRYIMASEDNAGRLVRLAVDTTPTKPEYLLIAYRYDENGNLIETENDEGHGYAFEYDEANRIVLRRGRKNFRFYFKYDDQGRCVLAVGDERLYGVALEYTVPGRVTKVTRPNSGVWTYKFTKRGELEEIHDPLGGVQKFVHDVIGLRVMEIDPNGNASKYIYDTPGEAIAKIDPFGHKINLPEDINAPDPKFHRVAANAVEFEYGRLVSVDKIVLPDQQQAANLGLKQQLFSIRSATEELAGRENGFDVPPLRVLWWPKPKRGRIFNDLGKLLQQKDDFGRVRQWTYDESGNVAEYIDFDGGKWLFDYGSWHFLRGLTDPTGSEVRYTYNSYGSVASFTDAGGTRSEYDYDLKDYLVRVRRHGTVKEAYTRDTCGNLIAKHTGDGHELLRFEVGYGNLPVRRILASGDVHTFEYDKSGRYLIAATKKDRVEFAYDCIGNRTLEKRNGLGSEYCFQGWRMPAESVFFERFTVRYSWQGNTLTIVDPGGECHEIHFMGYGLTKRRFSNGSEETIQYDGQGRCLCKHAQHRSGEVWTRRYHWSGEGELRRVEDNLRGDVFYEYDAAHRLRSRVIDSRIENYEMDIANNLVLQPNLSEVTLQEGNRLKAANGVIFKYNERNHIESRQSTEKLTRYIYDSRDQLVRVECTNGIWEAEYDALGRRIRKVWAGKTTEYYWNTDQLIAEVHANGRMRIYIYADPLALSPVMFLDYESAYALPEECKRYFIFSDQLGTPYLIEDEQGRNVWGAYVAPFGDVQIYSNSTIEFNLRFPGHYWDGELNLHYNRFRYYDPTLGRYIQSDPWGVAGGYNLYAYCTNPLGVVDVRGLGEDGDDPSNCPQPGEDGPSEEGPRPPPGFPTEDEVRQTLPVFDGQTTHGVLVTNEGDVVPLTSGTRPEGYSNYESAAHVEGQAAIYIRENNSSGGVVFHNNPNGTCGYCNSHVETLLPQGSQMVVVPPEGARANNSRATAHPTIYTGNSNEPKQPQ
jgi:RHS repeat-associated protein